MESEYKSIRRSIAQFRSIDLVLTCVDIGMLAFSLKETVGCVPAGLSEMHRSVGKGWGDEVCAACRVCANRRRPFVAMIIIGCMPLTSMICWDGCLEYPAYRQRGSADRLRPKLVPKRRPLISMLVEPSCAFLSSSN